MCNSTDLPEVEIISLLEEQLPHYKLRADTIYGYDHDDWLHTPLISPDANFDLTTEQIEETLKYFRKSKYIRCAQMQPPIECIVPFSMVFSVASILGEVIRVMGWVSISLKADINMIERMKSSYQQSCFWLHVTLYTLLKSIKIQLNSVHSSWSFTFGLLIWWQVKKQRLQSCTQFDILILVSFNKFL